MVIVDNDRPQDAQTLPSGAPATGVGDAGLPHFAADLDLIWGWAAVFVDKILPGTKPADLPVEQPTKFNLIINLRTAKAIGPKIPRALLLRADQVIQ